MGVTADTDLTTSPTPGEVNQSSVSALKPAGRRANQHPTVVTDLLVQCDLLVRSLPGRFGGIL